MVCIQYYNSPCGELILASTGDELCLCDWNGLPCADRNMRRIGRYMHADFCVAPSAVLEETKRQLDEYFAGKRKLFDIQLHPVGTDFQRRVWSALSDIPYGETRSYMEIATRIGHARGGEGRGTSHWRQRHRHPNPLPSRHWQQQLADRLCGRTGQKRVFVGT